MRLRLGLLRDTGSSNSSSSDRQSAKEAATAAASAEGKKHVDGTQKSLPEEAGGERVKAKEKEREKEKPVVLKPRIRPLSEAKAIDSGANFISEAFLFFVAGSLIVFESWRSRRKENNRREDVAGRLAELEESERKARRAMVALEKEILALESGERPRTRRCPTRSLPPVVWEVDEHEESQREEDKSQRWKWFSWLRGLARSTDDDTSSDVSTNLPPSTTAAVVDGKNPSDKAVPADSTIKTSPR